jgi:ABC-2 type transport system ATP-binding protein
MQKDSLILDARNLKKLFKTKRGIVEAVVDVSLKAYRGEIVGLLGPNGAGKTTTLRMLITLLKPTEGEVFINGINVLTNGHEARRHMGYVAQGGSSDPDCTVMEELLTQARLYGIGPKQAYERALYLSKKLELTDFKDRLIKTLSGGQKRRLEVALGLVHNPPLIFLDEPTTGLDPQTRANLWEHIKSLKGEGTTVLLTTHYLDEADALCDRIVIMDHGKVVAEGTPEELKNQIAGDVVIINVARATQDYVDLLMQLPKVREVKFHHSEIHLTVNNIEQAILDILRVSDSSNTELLSVRFSKPTLDEVFFRLTGRSLREGENDA